jgi:hypothetical protein
MATGQALSRRAVRFPTGTTPAARLRRSTLPASLPSPRPRTRRTNHAIHALSRSVAYCHREVPPACPAESHIRHRCRAGASLWLRARTAVLNSARPCFRSLTRLGHARIAWKRKSKCRADTFICARQQPTLMTFDDGAAYGKADAHASRLCGVESVEYPAAFCGSRPTPDSCTPSNILSGPSNSVRTIICRWPSLRLSIASSAFRIRFRMTC